MMRSAPAWCLAGFLLASPAAAAAQGGTPAPPQPMQVESVESGFVIAPDARFTELNGDFATLAGAYGGWLWEDAILVGGGAYWLANGHDGFGMAYGGPVVGILVRGDRRIAFGARALVGAGSATMSDTFAGLFGRGPISVESISRITRFGARSRDAAIRHDTRLTFRDNFFIAEPQATVLLKLADWIRLDAGIGYRVIGYSDLMDDRLKGLSGTVALRLLR
jgi:hypothetical protein